MAIWQDHPRRRSPLKFCMRGRIREVVIYFRSCGGSKIALSHNPIDLAHGLYINSLYYRIQAVIARHRTFPTRSYIGYCKNSLYRCRWIYRLNKPGSHRKSQHSSVGGPKIWKRGGRPCMRCIGPSSFIANAPRFIRKKATCCKMLRPVKGWGGASPPSPLEYATDNSPHYDNKNCIDTSAV